MIITITDVHQEFTKGGAEYLKVTGVTSDGKETTKSVFDNLKDKWPLLVENATLEFKMEKKGQFWNVISINKAGDQLPPEERPPTADVPGGQEKPAPTDKMSKDDWADKDKSTRTSIERQKALDIAGRMADNGIIDPACVLSYAKAFEGFINGNIKVKDDDIFRKAISHCRMP